MPAEDQNSVAVAAAAWDNFIAYNWVVSLCEYFDNCDQSEGVNAAISLRVSRATNFVPLVVGETGHFDLGSVMTSHHHAKRCKLQPFLQKMGPLAGEFGVRKTPRHKVRT